MKQQLEFRSVCFPFAWKNNHLFIVLILCSLGQFIYLLRCDVYLTHGTVQSVKFDYLYIGNFFIYRLSANNIHVLIINLYDESDSENGLNELIECRT